MNLYDVFRYLSQSPLPVLFYFVSMPLAAWIVGGVAEGSKNIQFWRYIYAILVYAVAIPGIFAVTLNIYLFLFERQSVWEADMLLQFLPILSMIVTLMIIKRSLSFELIPGFGKLSGFLTLIAALMGTMWFVDRLRLVAFTYIPFSALVVCFVGVLLMIRFAWSKLF